MISSLEEDVPFSNTIFPADAKGMVRNTKPFISSHIEIRLMILTSDLTPFKTTLFVTCFWTCPIHFTFTEMLNCNKNSYYKPE